MPAPSKRTLANRNRLRDTTGKIMEQTAETVEEDWIVWEEDTNDLLNHTERIATPKNINEALFDDGSSSKRPRNGHYNKTSAVTIWRKKKQAKTVEPANTILNFGVTISYDSRAEEKEEYVAHTKKELEKIRVLFKDMPIIAKPVMNKSLDGSNVDSYNHIRYVSVQQYFQNRLEGLKKHEAAKKSANSLWPNCSKFYRHKAIIKWANEYLENQVLSNHSQGVHAKRVSFLADNDVKTKVLDMIKKTTANYRTVDNIKKFIDEDVIPATLGVTGSVGKTTVARYLYEWGYSYRKNKKAIFFDGHERPDVVEYRQAWSKRMLKYMERSEFYQGDNQEEVLEPVLNDGEKKIVFVTHDESTFYANDGKSDFWLTSDENYIRKKGPGSSIMISEFQCPCHGTMKSGAWTSRRYFKAGGDREGWWTYKHMVEQLKDDAIELFELIHPNCVGVFLFDNSSNHSAFAEDALVASRMTLKEKIWPVTEKFQFRPTTVTLTSGEVLKQDFFFEKVSTLRDRKGKTITRKERYFKGK